MKQRAKILYNEFKHWLDYSPPAALTSEGWDSFREEFRKNAPIRHYIKYGHINVAYRTITGYLTDIKFWVMHRTVSRHHIVNSGLKPGWVYTDKLLLHTSFSILNSYIESCYRSKTHKFSRTFRRIFSNTKYKESVVQETIDRISDPAQIAFIHKEATDLYIWWNKTRNERENQEISIPELNTDEYREYLRTGVATASVAAYVDAQDRRVKQINAWNDEDEQKLIKLITIRTYLY